MTELKSPRRVQEERLTVRQTRNSLSIWAQAKLDGDLACLCELARPIPQDTNAGLVRLSNVLGDRSLMAAATGMRLLLNVYTISCGLMKMWNIWKDPSTTIELYEGLEGHSISLKETKIEVCMAGSNSTNITCTEYNVSRLGAWEFLKLFEACIVLPLAFTVVIFIFGYLASRSFVSEDGSYEVHAPDKPSEHCSRHSLPYDRPWFFIFGPRRLAGFSSIVFINFCDYKVFHRLWLQGQGEFYKRFFQKSVCIQDAMNEEEKNKMEELFSKHKKNITVMESFKNNPLSSLAFGVMYFCLIAFSLQALVIKLTALHFVGSSDFGTWPWRTWGVFMGFVNQIIGAFECIDFEWGRLLLFVFGGADCRLETRENMQAWLYFRFLARKLVKQSSHDFISRLSTVTKLVTIGANDMQKLLLSHRKDTCIQLCHEKRLQFLKDLNTSDAATDYFTDLGHALGVDVESGTSCPVSLLTEAKQKYVAFLEKKRDELMHEAQSVAAHGETDISKSDSESKRKSPPPPASELFRIVFEIQAKIEECKDLRFSDDELQELSPVRSRSSSTTISGTSQSSRSQSGYHLTDCYDPWGPCCSHVPVPQKRARESREMALIEGEP